MISRYLDPKNDLAFKKIFGAEKHKNIPIDFLNAVFNLEGPNRIIDLEFLNTLQPPQIEARKESIVDVLVQDQRGFKYIVEMQVAKIQGFEERAQFYAAKTYCSHFGKGQKYHDLKRVIFLAITDYVVFPNKSNYKSDHITLDRKSHENDLKAFSFTFVELPKFIKPLEELVTIEEKWYYFLKHADEDHNIHDVLATHSEIQEAYEILDRHKWSEKELQWYEKLLMNTADAQGMLDAAREEGLQHGKEIGIEQERKRLAAAMLKSGLSPEVIAKLTSSN